MHRTLATPHNHRRASSRCALRLRADARCDEHAASLRHALQLRAALLGSVLQFVIAATFCYSLLLQQGVSTHRFAVAVEQAHVDVGRPSAGVKCYNSCVCEVLQ